MAESKAIATERNECSSLCYIFATLWSKIDFKLQLYKYIALVKYITLAWNKIQIKHNEILIDSYFYTNPKSDAYTLIHCLKGTSHFIYLGDVAHE